VTERNKRGKLQKASVIMLNPNQSTKGQHPRAETRFRLLNTNAIPQKFILHSKCWAFSPPISAFFLAQLRFQNQF